MRASGTLGELKPAKTYSRQVCFADRTVMITTDVAEGQPLIKHIFGDIADQSSVKAHCEFTISRPDQLWLLQQKNVDADQSNLQTDKLTLFKGKSAGDLASVLVGEVIYHLTDRCDSGLVLHAAAVARDGVCIALPAASGSGKTTLCAWLVSQGWCYLTDELIHIPRNTLALNYFTRPLNFKRSAYSLIASEFGLDTDAEYAVTGNFASLIAHRQLADWSPPASSQLTHLVFPHYRADHSDEMNALSPARAGLSLMECLVNARNLPQHGFEEVSRIVRELTSHTFEYSSFTSARTKLLPAVTPK